MRLLVVGSHPGNSMPAALRTRLRPPSHPTRYSARSDGPSDSATSTPVSSCANPVTSRCGRAAPRARRPSRRGSARCGSATSRATRDAEWEGRRRRGGPRRTARSGPPAPPRGTDRRFRADRGSRWCASADHLRACREGPGWSAADNRNVHGRQRQLARQHQPGRTASGDHHRMPGHRHAPTGYVDNNTRISLLPFPSAPACGRRSCRTTRGLPQAPER